MTKLSSIADYVTDKISSNDIALREYVTTDCILQNKKGREIATNLPPQSCCLTCYQRGDVLIANIRPYLKKVWFADIDGGASSDVLVFRAKEGHSPSFLYAVLLQDSFFDYVMQGAKGSKMPRGDKEQILRYEMPTLSCSEESIGTFFLNLDQKIRLNEQINQNLEAMAKQLYDYWFVQFDFPNKDGRPYKSSGGKMVWNKKIKREIPEGWKEVTLNDFIDKNKGGDWGYDTPKDGTIKVGCVRGADIIKLNDVPTRHITSKHSDRLLEDGDIVIEISGGSPVQATGRVALITNGVIERNGGALVCSNFCQSFNMKKREFSEYFYYLWQNLYDNDNMFNFEGKTSGIKNFQTDVFLANYWFEVPEPLIETFHTIVAQYHLMIDQNIIENNNLIKQRDKLLPLLMNGQVSVNSDLSVYKKKRRGRIPSLTLNQVSDIQILHRQSIVLLTKQVLMDELQSERLIILVIIPFGTEIFVPIAWHVLLEETSQVFQAFGLVLLEVAAHDDDAPVGEVASSVAVLPEADVAVQITLTDVHAKAVGILHHATTVSVAELLTQVEIEIKNQIFLFHN